MAEKNRLAISAIQILWLVGSAVQADETTDTQSSAANVKQVIAHRGASAERPECTMAAIRRAIKVGATAVELDVRTSLDGKLFILHDATLDRTSNAKGPANALTLEQLQKLDAGSWFDPAYHKERIPSLIDAVRTCQGKIDVLLDLKQQGDEYNRRVVRVIREYGDPSRTIVGVRSVAQAKRFRELLPDARQLALIPSPEAIEEFAAAGTDMIRLWPRWLKDSNDPVRRVSAAGKELHLNGTTGDMAETLALLLHSPNSLSPDPPGQLRKTLKRLAAEIKSNLMQSTPQSSVRCIPFSNCGLRRTRSSGEFLQIPRHCARPVRCPIRHRENQSIADVLFRPQ